jgi:transposase
MIQQINQTKKYGEYIGMDVHKRVIHATVINGIGEKMIERRFANNPQELKEFTELVSRKAKIVMEASSVWQCIYDSLEEQGFNVKLAHPLKVRAIASARIKTDSIDSETLAQLLRADLIPEAYVPEKNMRELREFVRHRAMLVKMRTEIKNRVHAFLARKGIFTELTDIFGKEGMEFLKNLQLTDKERLALDAYLHLVEHIKSELNDIDLELFEIAKDNEDAQLLTTVPGLGIYSALLIVSEIGDINRFHKAKNLCSYAGLVPSVYQSGNKIRRGKLTKQGSKWLRWIMIQAAHHAVKKEGNLQNFYFRVANKRGKKIAIAGSARKLLTTVFYMLKDHKEYEEAIKHQFNAQAKGDSVFFME